jgi:hypothetical protein
MILTPQQRIEAYKYAIAYYEGSNGYNYKGMCLILRVYLKNNSLGNLLLAFNLLELFPEIKALRPLSAPAYWFRRNQEGKMQRIELLTKAIELAEKSEV